MTSSVSQSVVQSEIQTLTAGVHHVGLTVSDLQASVDFFTQVLGFSTVGGKPDYPATFVSDGTTLLTLWQIKEPGLVRPFDRHQQVGLHHLALKASIPLQDLYTRLNSSPGVEIEFAPEALGSTGLHHLMCRIPGGLRLELVGHV